MTVRRWDWERLLGRLPKDLISATDRAVGMRLATYAGENGGIRPSGARVADECALSRRAVVRSWQRLREIGLLAPGDGGDRLAWTDELVRLASEEEMRRGSAQAVRRLANAERMRRARAAKRARTTVTHTAERASTTVTHVRAPGDNVRAPGSHRTDQNRPIEQTVASPSMNVTDARESTGMDGKIERNDR